MSPNLPGNREKFSLTLTLASFNSTEVFQVIVKADIEVFEVQRKAHNSICGLMSQNPMLIFF